MATSRVSGKAGKKVDASNADQARGRHVCPTVFGAKTVEDKERKAFVDARQLPEPAERIDDPFFPAKNNDGSVFFLAEKHKYNTE